VGRWKERESERERERERDDKRLYFFWGKIITISYSLFKYIITNTYPITR
jgi:hypothetical protein